MLRNLLLFWALFLSLFSCKHENAGDKVRPVITMANPIPAQHFNTGDALPIRGLVEDNQRLKEIPVRITDENTQVLFFSNRYGPLQSSTFNIDTSYVITTTATTRLSVVVEAEDQAGNKVQKEIVVNIN